MDNKKYMAGVRFNEDLYINFIWNQETETIEIYKNGELISSGGGVTPEELQEILEGYVSKEEFNESILPLLITINSIATDETAGIIKLNTLEYITVDDTGAIITELIQ